MNKEKHCSVIDAEGRHVTYVLVKIRDKPLEDGSTERVEEVQNYTLKDGEQLVDTQPPVMRQHAVSTPAAPAFSRRSGAARTGRRPPRPTRSPPGSRSTRRRRSSRHR